MLGACRLVLPRRLALASVDEARCGFLVSRRTSAAGIARGVLLAMAWSLAEFPDFDDATGEAPRRLRLLPALDDVLARHCLPTAYCTIARHGFRGAGTSIRSLSRYLGYAIIAMGRGIRRISATMLLGDLVDGDGESAALP